jgi:hypothetical protein
MSMSIAALGLLVALSPFEGDPAERTRVELESVARVIALLPAQADEPSCADIDKRRQLRGRLDPQVVKAATWFLNLPMGAGRFHALNGRRYAFCLEPHYHPPGFRRGPQGWHKGVTVYDAE